MVSISRSELAFIEEGVADNMRSDGRGRLDARTALFETGVMPQANGSSHVQIGATDVLVGVKAEVGAPDAATPDQGLVKVSIDCAASALGGSLAGNLSLDGTSAVSSTLATRIEQTYKDCGAVDLASLGLIPHRSCWIVYVDVLVLDSGGNLVDAIALAMRAALFNTRLPRVNVVASDTVGELDIEISDDPDDCVRIDVANVPVFVTLTKIGNDHVVDATIEEEACEASHVTVAVSRDGELCGVHKGGQGGLDPASLYAMLQVAAKLGGETIEAMDAVLQAEDDAPDSFKSSFLH